MRDRCKRQDNFGRAFPKPLGIGLATQLLPHVTIEDEMKVFDPQVAGAWIVSDTTIEVND